MSRRQQKTLRVIILDYLKSILSNIDLSSFSIPTIRFNTIIDILVVSVLAYQAIIWIKETRAWSLLKGLSVLILVSLFAYLFNLYTISWIISNTFSVGIIAIIVLFQPELRKMLEQIGKGKIVDSFKSNVMGESSNVPKLSQKSTEAIYEACIKLSAERTGALIVVSQDVPLGEYINNGITIDAAISTQLLMNIFVDKTPLHDGAVIIKDDRIAAASCILPLTASSLSSELGTRHRASVGISESSDAYAIVVSEETGSISVAHNGKLSRTMSEVDFRKLLFSFTKPVRIRKLFGKEYFGNG